MQALSLFRTTLAYVRQHWPEILLLLVLWRIWRWRKADLIHVWNNWSKPAWLKVPRTLRFGVRLIGALFIYFLFTYQAYSYKEKGMPAEVVISPRLKRLFEHTRLVCFGRYAMTVPLEAEVLWGTAYFPTEITIIQGGIPAMKKFITDDIAEIRKKDDTNEIVASEKGPVPDSWQTRWYADDIAKESGYLQIKTYVNKGDLSFFYSLEAWESPEGSHQDRLGSVLEKHFAFSRSLRLRNPDENPATPGFCIDHAFIAADHYADQEEIDAGIYLPSLPDVTFSVSSNKNAYGNYDADTFKTEVHGLLERIDEAKAQGGLFYPGVNVLRQGKRDVGHWKGEESLVRRPDGVHDFEWALVGTPRSVANPSEFGAQLYTKVAHNTVGAAEKAALSNDETVALWDKLLGSLKFRVPVPGAPAGSAYIEPDPAK